jgi:hypothetical protein
MCSLLLKHCHLLNHLCGLRIHQRSNWAPCMIAGVPSATLRNRDINGDRAPWRAMRHQVTARSGPNSNRTLISSPSVLISSPSVYACCSGFALCCCLQSRLVPSRARIDRNGAHSQKYQAEESYTFYKLVSCGLASQGRMAVQEKVCTCCTLVFNDRQGRHRVDHL